MELESRPTGLVSSAVARHGKQQLATALPRAGEALLLGAVLCAAGAMGLLWMFTVPFQKGPDEGAHLQVVRFILDNGRLPVFRPEELWLIKVPQGVVETYATFPPLTYLAMALLAWGLPVDLMWGARLISLASYVGTIGLIFLIGRRLFRDEPSIAIVAALCVAFLPQFAFTGAYANNDAPAVLESAALFYLLVVLWQQADLPPPLRGRVGEGGLLLAIGTLAGALLITKYPFYPVAGLALLVPFVSIALERRSHPWPALVLPLLGAAVVSAWWFLRNWQLYQEWVPGQVVAAAKAESGGNTLFVPIDAGITLLTLSTETNFWQLTLQSFVAGFGWLDIFLPSAYYLVCAAFAGIAVLGLIAGGRMGPLPLGGRMVLVVSASMVAGTVLSAMAISVYGEYSPQGRYLFPVLVPVALGLSTGWTRLVSIHRHLRWTPAAAALTLLTMNVLSLTGYVIPIYYGPGSESITVQIDRPAVPQSAATEIEVFGWSFIEGGEAWRPYAPDLVANYRRPVSHLAVYVDGPPGEGVYHGVVESGEYRRDVGQLYGGIGSLEWVGYRLLLPSGSVPPGDHRMYVCALAGVERAPACSSRPFKVL